MANVVEVRIKGLSEIQDKLEHLPIKASRVIMRRSLKKAGQPWLEEMKAHVRRGIHRFPGGQKVFDAIYNALTISVTARSDVSGKVSVGVPRDVYWAKWVEKGTKLRPRVSRKKRGRKGPVRPDEATSGVMPAFPFAFPAFQAKKEQVLKIFLDDVKQSLNDAGLKLN